LRFDLPSPDNDTQEFWDGARRHQLLIQRCGACGDAFFYPRPFCPKCWSDDVATEEATGDATLYTWSVVHVNDLPPFHERVPYVAAIVDLVEGPRMMTNVVDCDAGDLEVGMALRVSYRELTPEVTIPVFVPA
jgi:uncharacterized OB-fold protein